MRYLLTTAIVALSFANAMAEPAPYGQNQSMEISQTQMAPVGYVPQPAYVPAQHVTVVAPAQENVTTDSMRNSIMWQNF